MFKPISEFFDELFQNPTYKKFSAFLKTTTGGLTTLWLTWGAYFVLLWSKMLYKVPGGWMSGYRTLWADWALHLTLANVFAFRSMSDWFTHHPVYYPGSFNYPFMSAFLSGMLIRLGIPPIQSFIIPSIVFTLFLLSILFLFYKSFLKTNSLSFLGVTLFLASGGLGFIYFFHYLCSPDTFG